MIKSEIKEQVAAAARKFWDKGLSTGRDGGDLSIRDPETNYIYICPKPGEALPKIVNWGITKAEHIVVIDINGNKVEDTPIDPTVEYPMHTYIYQNKPEINAIVHSHAEYSSAFAITRQNIPHALAETKFIGGEIVCAEYGAVGSIELAENILKALGENKKAALLCNHGAVTIGKTMEDAFIVSDYLEKLAKVVIMAKSLGEIIPLPQAGKKNG